MKELKRKWTELLGDAETEMYHEIRERCGELCFNLQKKLQGTFDDLRKAVEEGKILGQIRGKAWFRPQCSLRLLKSTLYSFIRGYRVNMESFLLCFSLQEHQSRHVKCPLTRRRVGTGRCGGAVSPASDGPRTAT